MTRAAVLGAGSWGTAFAAVLANAGTSTVLWGRRPELVDAMRANRQNPDYLPDVELPRSLDVTASAPEALSGADLVVMAVPSQTLRASLTGWAAALPPQAVLVSLMKGIEVGSGKRMSEVIREVTGAQPERVAVVTGPNLAREIAERQPAAAVVASTCEDTALALQRACHTAFFRPYTNTDVVGCELGGTVKNCIALAVGMAAGLGFGDNCRASVITRGLAETARLGAALGADPYTFAGLAGLGDLVATCSSPLSRNRTLGERLGRGATLEEAVGATRQVAEGVKSCESVRTLAARAGVDMPIVDHVSAVVRGEMTARDTISALLSRTPQPERR